MDQQFAAIYENGVLRLLTPLDLPDHAQVSGSISLPEPRRESRTDADIAAKQKSALQELWDKIDADPAAAGPDDGWSAANNVDDVLYGGPNGPA